MRKMILCLSLSVFLVSNLIVFPSYATTNLKVGAWLGGWPTEQSINDFESLQGRHMDVVNMFISFDTSFNNIRPYVDSVYNNDSNLMLTWEPWGMTNLDLSNGIKDSYINQMADDIKTYGKPIMIRLMHEMNSFWYPWAIGFYDDPDINAAIKGVHQTGTFPNNNTSYVNAFRHVVDIFKSKNISNVKFVYCVNNANCNSEKGKSEDTSYLGPYPGDDYVDYVSIDGYNSGTTTSYSSWVNFDQIFSSAYNSLKQRYKPVIIAEYGSTEQGGNKADWIRDAFQSIKYSGKYDLIRTVLWFNENKETDWTINSSDVSQQAFKLAVSDLIAPYQKTIPGDIEAEFYDDMSGIDTETCAEGTQNVGWTESGDWLEYDVDVKSAGNYLVEFRVAGFGGQFSIKSGNGSEDIVTVPNMDNWQSWTSVYVPLNLSQGKRKLRLDVITGGFNLNYINFNTSTPTPTLAPTPTPTVTPELYSLRGYIAPEFNYTSQAGSILNKGFQVEVSQFGKSANSDENGYFIISGVSPGIYDLKVTKIGYLNRVIKSLSVQSNLVVSNLQNPIVLWAGDINGDDVINMADIMLIAKAFNTVKGDAGYQDLLDIDSDQAINLSDVMIIARGFNKTSADY